MASSRISRRTGEYSALESGGEPPYDGAMEARIAKLETAAEFIQRDIKELKEDVRALRNDVSAIRTTDFRILFGAIISVALGLAALMAKGFSLVLAAL